MYMTFSSFALEQDLTFHSVGTLSVFLEEGEHG